MTSKYLVWCPERGQTEADARTIPFAYSAAEAACQWARIEDHKNVDYLIAGGRETTVLVRQWVEGAKTEEKIVTGEMQPFYRVLGGHGSTKGTER
jgi:hypothetical protein